MYGRSRSEQRDTPSPQHAQIAVAKQKYACSSQRAGVAVGHSAAVLLSGIMILLLGHVLLAMTGPASMLEQWRTNRLIKWSRHLDRRYDCDVVRHGKIEADLRYHTKILVVDDCGERARVVESILDSVAENCEAPVDVLAATVGSAAAKATKPPARLTEAGVDLGLSPYSLEAGTQSLDPRALLSRSRFDLIVCTDLSVLERVRTLARGGNAVERAGGALPMAIVDDATESTVAQWSSHPSGEGMDVPVLCLTDFLATSARSATAGCSVELPDSLLQIVASDQFDQLEESLRLTGGHAGAAATAVVVTKSERVDLPRLVDKALGDDAYDSSIEALCAVAAPCCSALLSYLAVACREHAKRTFTRDLQASYPSSELLPDTLDELTLLQRQHAVPGGLSMLARQELFEEHANMLAAQSASPRSNPMRVDVSDLGLSMDDLAGPMGDGP